MWTSGLARWAFPHHLDQDHAPPARFQETKMKNAQIKSNAKMLKLKVVLKYLESVLLESDEKTHVNYLIR